MPALTWLRERAALDAAVPDAADPGRLAEALVAGGELAAALRLTACALPPREGVWWALVAARRAQRTAARVGAAGDAGALAGAAREAAALKAAERWIAEPTDAHRRQAWDAAQAAGLETPAGGAAAAAFFATGSLAPATSPMAVAPPPGAHATLAAGAVLLAAARTSPARLAEAVGESVAQGAEIARRLGGWDAAAAAARRHFEAQAEAHAEAARPPAPPGVPAAGGA